MSSYSDEYEEMRRRHRQAVAEKRLTDRQAYIDALAYKPSPPHKPASRATLSPAPSSLSAPAPDTHSLPAPLPVREEWSPGARPGRAWLGHYADVSGASDTYAFEEALLPSAVAGHTLVVGATRMGKTRLLLLLAGEALADGASVAALDLKDAQFTLGRLCAVADEAGLGPYDRALFLPSVSPGPGWNPLLEGPEAVAEILGIFIALAGGSWGPKMGTLFRSALALLQQRGLSLFELPALISDSVYTRALAGGVQQSHLGGYLLDRVTGKDADTDPVLNKLLPILDVPYFERCLCAERNTFAMAQLWQRQTLACFHLDRRRLGEEGAGALGSMAARRLFSAAIQPSGPGQVVLLADEAGEVDRLSGGRMERTLSEGGESRLSLLLACQYLNQLPAGLRESALTNANLKCFFRLGPEDAKLVDRAIGVGWGARAANLDPQHCLVQVGKGTPRIVRVADLDPQPSPGWDRLGGHLRADEWEGLPDRRRAGIKAAVGRALPPLGVAESNWGKRPAHRDDQGRDTQSGNSRDGNNQGGNNQASSAKMVRRPEPERQSTPRPSPISWEDDGIS
ncbi:MAG: hypothetical protein ACRYFS_19880 [Janthinobacterium lividum]